MEGTLKSAVVLSEIKEEVELINQQVLETMRGYYLWKKNYPDEEINQMLLVDLNKSHNELNEILRELISVKRAVSDKILQKIASKELRDQDLEKAKKYRIELLNYIGESINKVNQKKEEIMKKIELLEKSAEEKMVIKPKLKIETQKEEEVITGEELEELLKAVEKTKISSSSKQEKERKERVAPRKKKKKNIKRLWDKKWKKAIWFIVGIILLILVVGYFIFFIIVWIYLERSRPDLTAWGKFWRSSLSLGYFMFAM
jgi:hypothetical protein